MQNLVATLIDIHVRNSYQQCEIYQHTKNTRRLGVIGCFAILLTYFMKSLLDRANNY